MDEQTPPKHPRLPGDGDRSSAKGLFTDHQTHTSGNTTDDGDTTNATTPM